MSFVRGVCAKCSFSHFVDSDLSTLTSNIEV